MKYERYITKEIPHGIRYSLTLHNQQGERIIGFDNAHAVKAMNKAKYQGRKTFDHKHRHPEDKGISYEFINAHQLFKDFWFEVDKRLHFFGLDEE